MISLTLQMNQKRRKPRGYKKEKVAPKQPLIHAVRFSKVGMRRLERPTPTSRT